MTASKTRGPRYSEREVQGLVEAYSVLREYKGTWRGLLTLCRLADIDRALRQLPSNERIAVLLHGMIGIEREEAGVYLGVSGRTVSRYYAQGLASMTRYLNGEEWNG